MMNVLFLSSLKIAIFKTKKGQFALLRMFCHQILWMSNHLNDI